MPCPGKWNDNVLGWTILPVILIDRRVRLVVMTNNEDAYEFRQALQILGYIPVTVFIHNMLMLLIAVFNFKHLPVYGIDPNPGSFNNPVIDSLSALGVITLFASYICIPLVFLISVHLLINKVRFTPNNLLSLSITIFVILWHFFFRSYMNPAFEWVMD